MENNRTINTIRNSFAEFLNTTTNIFIPFIMRTLVIRTIGEKYLGLNNLFHSVLSTLSLAQIGFGEAIAYCMYKPIALGDTKKVNSFLKLYRYIYIIIGILILCIGIILIPYLPLLIKNGSPTDVNIEVVYLIYLLELFFNYVLFADKSALLIALQRSDIESLSLTITQLTIYIIRIIVLLKLKNYYLFIVFIPISAIVGNLIVALLSKVKYPQYKCEGEVSLTQLKEITVSIKAIALQKFGTKVFQSIDNILISGNLGLTSVTIYSNYYYISSSLLALIKRTVAGSKSSVGNSIATVEINKNYELFNRINLVNAWLITCSIPCMFSLYQPFMRFWVGEKLMSDMSMVLLQCVYFFIVGYSITIEIYKDANGMWIYDKWRPIISGIAKIILFVHLFKINGIKSILISSIISSLLIDTPYQIYILFKYYFKKSPLNYLLNKAKCLIIIVITTVLCYCITKAFSNSVIGFILTGCICLCFSNFSFYIFYNKSYEFVYFVSYIKNIIKHF